MTNLIESEMIERIWINDRNIVREIRHLVLDCAHFRNLVLMFIHKYKEKYNKWLTHETLLYPLLSERCNTKRSDETRAKVKEIINSLDDELRNLLEKIKEQKNKINNTVVVQQIIRQIRKDFTSYFRSIKEYKKDPSKFTGEPKPPKPRKLKNITRFTIELNRYSYKQDRDKLLIKLRNHLGYNLTVKLSYNYEVTSVRICFFHNSVYLDLVRKVKIPKTKPLGEHIAGIDLGVDNLVTIVSTNPKVDSIIISGGIFKSFNQWFNKRLAEYRSELDKTLNEIKKYESEDKEVPKELLDKEKEFRIKINKLCVHRKKKLDSLIHILTSNLARWLYLTGHSKVYVGKLTTSKQNCNMGKINNQNFYFIPYREIINKLKYKLQLLGVKLLEVDESYTSKHCPICNDHELNRIKRGLVYCEKLIPKSKKKYNKGVVFNADCTGALNILKKGAKIKRILNVLTLKSLFRKLCNPVKYMLFEFVSYMKNVVPESSNWRIGDSLKMGKPRSVTESTG